MADDREQVIIFEMRLPVLPSGKYERVGRVVVLPNGIEVFAGLKSCSAFAALVSGAGLQISRASSAQPALLHWPVRHSFQRIA